VVFAAADSSTRTARLRVEQPAAVAGVTKYRPSRQLNTERDAFVIPLVAAQTSVDLSYRYGQLRSACLAWGAEIKFPNAPLRSLTLTYLSRTFLIIFQPSFFAVRSTYLFSA
jgi:hypothetical protein